MNEQKILTLAGQLVLDHANNNAAEFQQLAAQIAAELRQPVDENGSASAPPLRMDFIGFLKFTDKEILKMPKNLRNTFRAEGCTVHYRKRIRGKNSCSYEARYNLSVSAPNLQALKVRFIAALKANDKDNPLPGVPTNFHEFATYYFETFWRRTVTAQTYKTETNRYKNHIQPLFGSLPIKSITPGMCQQLLDGITAKGYGKTADEVHGRLNQIFEAAIKHGLIKFNPLDIVVFIPHECEHGIALTKEEERRLLELTAGTVWQLMFAVALYTGLRPNEYASARIEGAFIVAVNSKRKNKKVEYKKIPISPMLRPYLEGVEELRFYVPQRIREKFRALLPGHSLKDMRETFNTRCVECGVNETARKRFMGHSLGALGEAYTDLSDEFLIAEGNKLNY